MTFWGFSGIQIVNYLVTILFIYEELMTIWMTIWGKKVTIRENPIQLGDLWSI